MCSPEWEIVWEVHSEWHSLVNHTIFLVAQQLDRLISLSLQMFSVIPQKFLPGMRNPCWYEAYTGNITSDPYRTNLYARYSRRFRTVFQHLRNTFQEHLFHRDGNLYRMRCLPYFYIIGQPKCGTTDLYDRLRLHPDVKFTTFKEPHWWTRKRFGEYRNVWFDLTDAYRLIHNNENLRALENKENCRRQSCRELQKSDQWQTLKEVSSREACPFHYNN